MMIVTIPNKPAHQGYSRNLMTVEISDVCPDCNGPRGEAFRTHSFDGSRRLTVDGWRNPCGHVDTYSAVRSEVRLKVA